MFNILTSPLAYLRSRRSGRPRDMVAPGPSPAQLAEILAIAARTPDHGKLAPWRFITIAADQREAFAALLQSAYLAAKPEAGRLEREAVDQFARQAPALVVVLSSPRHDSHIPLWEQQLSAGAACMNLIHAAHAHGFVASWITGWAAFSDPVRDAFGDAGDQIAGFIFIGSPGAALEERPRPDAALVARCWEPRHSA